MFVFIIDMYKILIVTLIFFLVLTLIKLKNKELFDTNSIIPKRKSVKRVVCNILPRISDDGYIGTFLPEKGSSNNTLIYTRSLKSNTWIGPLKNGAVDKSSVIIDLTYDSDKVLMCVALNVKKGNSVFKIYKKESRDLNSKWIQIDKDSKVQIRSLVFDFDKKLMGCSEDGQIYKKRNVDYMDSDWIGPINYDIPMKKIFFDKDMFLLGIGLLDNNLYKKEGFFWSKEQWDKKNVNKKKLYDCVHDTDGHLLVTTSNGIKKAETANYLSNFINYSDFEKETTVLLNKDDILKFRTGISELSSKKIIEDENYDDLEIPFKQILDFKKKAKEVCNNRGAYLSKDFNKTYNNILLVNKQSEEINQLENMIKQMEDQMGYSVNREILEKEEEKNNQVEINEIK